MRQRSPFGHSGDLPDATPPNDTRLGAKAAFAAAAFALAILTIFALERVGAPDRLVVALGPLTGIAGVVGLGLMTRTKTLLDFLVARRNVPPLYAGFALAAPVGGFALAFSAAADPAKLPWRGVVCGILAATLIIAPRWRAAQASAMADVLATRFPSPFARIAFALILGASGWALAAAGLGYAAMTVRDAVGVSLYAATMICAGALVVSLAPGGMRSLVWTDAASAAAGLATMGVFVALSAHGEDADRLAISTEALSRLPSAPLVQEIAAGFAVASLFAFVCPALSTPSPQAARGAGVVALIVLAAGGAAAAALGNLALKSPSDTALAGLIACLPALALARAGVYAAARAIGLDLARASKRLSVLASRRMASVRYGVLVGAAAAAFGAHTNPNPSTLLYFGLASWLAFGAPSLLLATLPGRRSTPAHAALAASVVAALAGRLLGFGDPSYGPELLVGALGAGLAGFAVGLGAYVLESERGAPAQVADPFVDLPEDASMRQSGAIS